MGRQSPMTRQQQRFERRQQRKLEKRKPLSEKAKRLAFTAAKAKFAEVTEVLKKYPNGGAELGAALRGMKPLRHRGKGRGTPSRRYGNPSSHTPHQGRQECLRRVIGGWAWSIRTTGLTKNAALDEVNAHRRDIAAHTLLTGERLAV